MRWASRTLALALAAGAALALSCADLFGQWSPDPSVNLPVCTAPRAQIFPSIAPDGAGGAVIAWRDTRDHNHDVYAQKVDRSGFTRWAADGVPLCRGITGRTEPVIIPDGFGGAVVAWDHKREPDLDIFAQRIDVSGNILWEVGGVPVCSSAGDQAYPSIAPDGSGGAIIVWLSFRTLEDGDIYVQRMTASGERLWSPDGVWIGATGWRVIDRPRIVSDGSGGAIIAWSNGSLVQRVDASGAIQWRHNGVQTGIWDEFWPVVDSDGFGGIVLAVGLRAQRVSSTGGVRWSSRGVPFCEVSADQIYPAIASDGAGGAFIAWQDARNWGGSQTAGSPGSDHYEWPDLAPGALERWRNETYFGGLMPSGRNSRRYWSPGLSSLYDIYAQRIDASGRVSWGTDGVPICTTYGSQALPSIVGDGQGGAMIAWYDCRDGPDIHAQRVDSLGSVQWEVNGIAVCTTQGFQDAPVMAAAPPCGAVLAWSDDRNGESDIYAQNVNLDGSLGMAGLLLVTGGGWIHSAPNGVKGKRTFGFNVHARCNRTYGQIQYHDHGAGVRMHSDTVLTAVVEQGDTVADFGGTCRVNGGTGYSFRCRVADRGEPGRGSDYFGVEVYDPEGELCHEAGGTLGGGNVQIHDSPDFSFASRWLPSRPEPETEPGIVRHMQGAGRPARTAFRSSCSPNPFCARTAIRYALSARCNVRLEIFDVGGRLIETLVCAEEDVGIHTAFWDAGDRAGGVYFYRLGADSLVETAKMVHMK